MIKSVIPYKEGIFSKIYKFFKGLFRKKTNVKTNIEVQEENNDFKEKIVVEEDKEKKRILDLREKWENGEIYEEDISDEDIDKIVEMYNEETKKIEEKTKFIKQDILKMLKELKQEN